MKTYNVMFTDPSTKEKLEKAKKRVSEIKGFYIHLIIYLIVNTLLLLIAIGIFNKNFSLGMPSWGHFTTPFFWGIGLFFHYLKVFGNKIKSLKNWEERKIQQYLDKEDDEFERFL